MVEQIWPEHSLEVLRRLKRHHFAPYLTMMSEPLVGPGWSWRGSRFWALDDESHDDSEDEDTKLKGVDPNDSFNSKKKLLHDAMRVGFSVDEVIRAESLLT